MMHFVLDVENSNKIYFNMYVSIVFFTNLRKLHNSLRSEIKSATMHFYEDPRKPYHPGLSKIPAPAGGPGSDIIN